MVHTTVICLGNDLVADDRAGKLVYDSLCRYELPEGVSLLWGQLDSINVMERCLDTRRLIIVDAVYQENPHGSVSLYTLSSLPSNPSGAVSLHGIGISEAFQIGSILYPGRLPDQMILVGIEGRNFSSIKPCTSEVADAIPKAVAIVNNIINSDSWFSIYIIVWQVVKKIWC